MYEQFHGTSRPGTVTEPETQISCASGQRAALVAFHGATGGNDWNTKWDLDRDYSQWHGVTVDAETGCVTRLELPNNNLNNDKFIGRHGLGMLGKLNALTHLNLSGSGDPRGNHLVADLPIELDKLTNLTHLNLAGNAFGGKLRGESRRIEWENLKNLVELDLSWNKRCGTFGCNHGVNGVVPFGFSVLPNLVRLDVTGNELKSGSDYFLPSSENYEARELFLDDNDWDDDTWREFNGVAKAIAKDKVKEKLEEAGLDLAGRVIDGPVVMAVAQRGATRGARTVTKVLLRTVPVAGQIATVSDWISYAFLGGDNPCQDYIDLFNAGATAVYQTIIKSNLMHLASGTINQANFQSCVADHPNLTMSQVVQVCQQP